MKKILLIATLGIFLSACQSGDKKEKLSKLISERDKLTLQIDQLKKELNMSKDSIKLVNVVLKTVEKQSFKHLVEIQGRVDGDQNVTVSPVMGGIITQILVNPGEQVTKGQLLMTLDGSVLMQTIQEVKTQLDFANTLFLKQKALYDQNIGSEVSFLSAKNNKNSLEKRLTTLNQQLDQMNIKSPINGSVEEIPVKIGQLMIPGYPAMKIINLSKIKVVADLAESFSPMIKKGNPVILFFPDVNKEITTNLTFASKLINPTNRTFQIETKIDNNGSMQFRANMVAVVKIVDYSNDSAITLPINLIQKSIDDEFVMIAVEKAGKMVAEKRIVKTGLTYNGLVEIKEGLQTGEQVINVGYIDLKEGQELNIN